MRILSHYFVARFFGLFLTVLVSAMAMLAAIELVLNLEELASLRVEEAPTGPLGRLAPSIVYLWTRLTALYVSDLLPIAAFVATFLTAAIAGRRLEWVAIESGGIRPLRVVLPLVGAAGLLSLVAAGLGETIVLDARHDRLVQSRFDPEDLPLERRAFWYHKGPIITNIGHADPDARTLFDVELFERGLGDASGRILRIVRAATVRILADGRWHFDRASVWRFDPDDPLAEPRFETVDGLELDLATLPVDPLAQADPAIAPLPTLARYVADTAGSGTPESRRLAQAYHDRLSRPLWVVAFSWLALPFGLAVDRRGRFVPAASGALLALAACLAAASGGAALTRLAALAPGLVGWGVPLLAIAVGTAGLVRRRV